MPWYSDLAPLDVALPRRAYQRGILVGISTGAVLFHPEFYKVAVSSCGCHDNRLDKASWNEQWMGLMGPHYEKQSNVTSAKKLQASCC